MKEVDETRLTHPTRWASRLSLSWTGAAQTALNLALLGAWVWLYWPVFQYLSVLLTREEFRTNQIVLASVAALLVYRLRKTRPSVRLDAAPRLFLPAAALLLAGSLGFLASERFLDVNTLSASLFVLASYGLAGLWMTPGRWKQGFPAMLLVVGVLPFGAHLETFLGYPLRILTAQVVRNGLAALGFHSVGVDTILVFESGVSQVDIPCSGVKSLWTGALFLLGVTWVESRPFNLRWLLAAVATGVLLAVANLLRVAALALTGPALGWTSLAEMLHVPLGVLGFLGACLAAYHLLGPAAERPAPAARDRLPAGAQVWLSALLLGGVAAMAAFYMPRPADLSGPSAAALAWEFPERLSVQPVTLSPQELAWIRQDGAERADRYAFTWRGEGALAEESLPVTGSLMLVTSQTWRGQHQPERCFQVFGLTVEESFTALVGADFPLRRLTLSAPGAPERVSAVYWLQSANQTTEDYGQRIWADLSPQRERWVLVTVLFDREYVANFGSLDQFLRSLHAAVGSSLEKGIAP